MKQSKIKKLVSRKQMERFLLAGDEGLDALESYLRREGADAIAKMRGKGYDLVSCLASGEGVFVREDNVVGLHIQLPVALYRKLDEECRQRGTTKRSMVVQALEQWLASNAVRSSGSSLQADDDAGR